MVYVCIWDIRKRKIRHDTARQGTERHGTVRHGMARHCNGAVVFLRFFLFSFFLFSRRTRLFNSIYSISFVCPWFCCCSHDFKNIKIFYKREKERKLGRASLFFLRSSSPITTFPVIYGVRLAGRWEIIACLRVWMEWVGFYFLREGGSLLFCSSVPAVLPLFFFPAHTCLVSSPACMATEFRDSCVPARCVPPSPSEQSNYMYVWMDGWTDGDTLRALNYFGYNYLLCEISPTALAVCVG